MKNDPIERLIKESQPKMSEGFTHSVMNRIERRLEKRMKFKVYLLVSAVIVYLIFTFYVLYSSGFTATAFGFEFVLPKVLTVLTLMSVGYFVMGHLIMILKLLSIRSN